MAASVALQLIGLPRASSSRDRDRCEKVGADVQDVTRGIGLDGRIGNEFLHAGPGYGGSGFPKSTLTLLKTANDHDARSSS